MIADAILRVVVSAVNWGAEMMESIWPEEVGQAFISALGGLDGVFAWFTVADAWVPMSEIGVAVGLATAIGMGMAVYRLVVLIIRLLPFT